jgi:two-component system response regulator YesN
MVRAVLIESNSSFRQTLTDIFDSRLSSIELIVAANGTIAMEKIETFPPDLILVNIKLPGEDSLDLTRKIKNRYPNVIIIVISSYDIPEYREAACRNGADYFISKDSPIEDYFSLIKSILTDRGLHRESPNKGGKS